MKPENNRSRWDKCLLCGHNQLHVKDDKEECSECGWTYQYRTPEMEKEIITNKIFNLIETAKDELPGNLYAQLANQVTKKLHGEDVEDGRIPETS